MGLKSKARRVSAGVLRGLAHIDAKVRTPCLRRRELGPPRYTSARRSLVPEGSFRLARDPSEASQIGLPGRLLEGRGSRDSYRSHGSDPSPQSWRPVYDNAVIDQNSLGTPIPPQAITKDSTVILRAGVQLGYGRTVDGSSAGPVVQAVVGTAARSDGGGTRSDPLV